MRSTFDRLREVRNRSISQVILDECRVLEKALPRPGLVDPVARSRHTRFERRRRTQKSVHGAWYVDCTSRPRGPAEGEEIQ